MKTHKELYPEQYNHPLVGKNAKVSGEKTFKSITRIVNSRFGMLAVLGDENKNAWPLSKLEIQM